MLQQVLLPYVLALIINEKNEVLFEYRKNTQWFANQYGLVGGKIDEIESAKEAIAREIFEEIGITVTFQDIEFAHVMHFMGEDTPCVAFFYNIHIWHGDINNIERNKHDHLAWFPLNKLPEKMIPRHKKAIELIVKKILYSEDNWK